jgi:hypothetical protein
VQLVAHDECSSTGKSEQHDKWKSPPQIDTPVRELAVGEHRRRTRHEHRPVGNDKEHDGLERVKAPHAQPARERQKKHDA